MAKKHDKKHKTAKPMAKTTLYRLIEVGQLARQRLLVPLHENGLLQGDDAILFSMTDRAGVTENQLCALTGLSTAALQQRLTRLEDMQILERLAVGPHLDNGARLTARGHALSESLQSSWQALETVVTDELKHSEKRSFRKNLKRAKKLLKP